MRAWRGSEHSVRAVDNIFEELEGELTFLEGGDNFLEGLEGELTFLEGGS